MNFNFENLALTPSFYSPVPSIAFLNTEIVYAAPDVCLGLIESVAWIPQAENCIDTLNNKNPACPKDDVKPNLDRQFQKMVTVSSMDNSSSSSDQLITPATSLGIAKPKEIPALISSTEAIAKSQSKKKKITNKKEIKFTYSSPVRKNVDKHIVRTTSSIYQKYESMVLADLSKYGISPIEYDEAKQVLHMLRKSEVKIENGVKKDYSKVINMFLNKRCILVILKYCLESSLEHFAEGKKVPRVTENNKKVYRTTIREYLDFVTESLNELLC